MDRQVEKEAADALLDRGIRLPLVRVKIPLRKRPVTLFSVVMRAPYLDNQIAITRLYLEMGFTYDEIVAFNTHEQLAFLAVHGGRLSRIMALMVLRSPASRPLVPLLAWYIRGFVRREHLLIMREHFIHLLGTKDFLPIIKSVEVANPLKPRTSQRRRKGS
jgi:hypothetical protein